MPLQAACRAARLDPPRVVLTPGRRSIFALIWHHGTMRVSEYSDLVHRGRIIQRSRQRVSVRRQVICATNARERERLVELTYPVSNPDRFGEATRRIEDTWLIMMRCMHGFPFQKQIRFIITTCFASSGFFRNNRTYTTVVFAHANANPDGDGDGEARPSANNNGIPPSAFVA